MAQVLKNKLESNEDLSFTSHASPIASVLLSQPTSLGNLGKLPREIRNKIFAALFDSRYSRSMIALLQAKTRNAFTLSTSVHMADMAILRASRAIGAEALDVFYASGTFIVVLDYDWCRDHDEMVLENDIRRIRNVEFCFQIEKWARYFFEGEPPLEDAYHQFKGRIEEQLLPFCADATVKNACTFSIASSTWWDMFSRSDLIMMLMHALPLLGIYQRLHIDVHDQELNLQRHPSDAYSKAPLSVDSSNPRYWEPFDTGSMTDMIGSCFHKILGPATMATTTPPAEMKRVTFSPRIFTKSLDHGSTIPAALIEGGKAQTEDGTV